MLISSLEDSSVSAKLELMDLEMLEALDNIFGGVGNKNSDGVFILVFFLKVAERHNAQC